MFANEVKDVTTRGKRLVLLRFKVSAITIFLSLKVAKCELKVNVSETANYTFCISFRENKQSFALKVKQFVKSFPKSEY